MHAKQPPQSLPKLRMALLYDVQPRGEPQAEKPIFASDAMYE
jgi:hypothetical protein